MSVTRLGYVSIKATDLVRAIVHYTEVVGLRVVSVDNDRVFLQSQDNQDHHCVVLNKAGCAGLDHVGFKVDDRADLSAIAALLHARGIQSEAVPAGAIKGQGAGVRFKAPSGHDLLFYHHADKIGYGTGMRNPDPVDTSVPRTGTTHLDHVALTCEQPEAFAMFLGELFGFYVTERANGPDGQAGVLFVTCSNKMHDLAILAGPNGAFHHMAFGLEGRLDVITRSDVLRQQGIPMLELGPTRHGIAGVTTVYFRDPAGNLNEFYHGAYLASGLGGNVPPIVWPAESSARGMFYYEGSVPSAFMATVT